MKITGGPNSSEQTKLVARSVDDLYRYPVGQSALHPEGQQTLWSADMRNNEELIQPETKIAAIGGLAVKASNQTVE